MAVMVCFICGNATPDGWVHGFPPAPESQKLALCKTHDTPENREKVAAAWQRMLTDSIAATVDVARQKTLTRHQLATIHFIGGGMASFSCLSCLPTPHGTLRIEEPDGTCHYLPLQQIRDYVLTPYRVGDEAL